MAKSERSKKVGTKEVTIEGIDIPLTGSSMVPVEEPEIAEFRVIEAAITQEIVAGLRGHFAPGLCYTKPRRSDKGRMSWPECDLMPNGCPYKGKQKHIHITGIGYHGAMEALQVYPGLIADIEEPPTIVEEAGRMIWRCKASCLDTKTGSSVSRYHVTPVMEMWGNKLQENEFAPLVVQSKALRNVVLAMIPNQLKEAWVEDFKRGGKRFSPPPEEPKKKSLPPAAKDKPKNKSKDKPVSAEAKKEFAAAVKQVAPKVGVSEEALLEFAKADFDTPAQATLWFVGAMDNESKLNGLKAKYTNWSNQKAQEEEAQKAAEAEKEEKPKAEEPEITMEGPDQPSLEGVPGGDN